MAEALRLFFLAFYAIGVLVLILRVLPLAVRSGVPCRKLRLPPEHKKTRKPWALR